MVAALADPDAFEAGLKPLVHPNFETVTVPGQDPFDLDRDGNGTGCEY